MSTLLDFHSYFMALSFSAIFLIFNPSEISSDNYFLLLKGAICIFSCNINIKVSEFNQFSKYYVAEENEKLRQWARAQYVL